MCVKEIIEKKILNERKPVKRLIMCAKTENYFLYHQCVSNLYKGVIET